MGAAGWTITFEGKAWCESDLTLADAVRALEISGGSWTTLHPLTGPAEFIGLLTTFLVVAGEDETAALERVARIRLVEALQMVAPGEPDPDAEDEAGDDSGVREPMPSSPPRMPAGAMAEVPV